MTRQVHLGEMDELAELAKGIEILSGTGTRNLYVKIDMLPVEHIDTDQVIGWFHFDQASEDFVFIPAKDKL